VNGWSPTQSWPPSLSRIPPHSSQIGDWCIRSVGVGEKQAKGQVPRAGAQRRRERAPPNDTRTQLRSPDGRTGGVSVDTVLVRMDALRDVLIPIRPSARSAVRGRFTIAVPPETHHDGKVSEQTLALNSCWGRKMAPRSRGHLSAYGRRGVEPVPDCTLRLASCACCWMLGAFFASCLIFGASSSALVR